MLFFRCSFSRRAILGGCLLSALFSHSALADSRLDKIRTSQTLIVGYQSDAFPFTYQNAQGQLKGFSIDLLEGIRQHLAESLNVRNLNLKLVATDDQNRFDMLNNGIIDITCSANTNSVERKQLVHFSNNFFEARLRLAVAKGSSINSYKDLDGKKVAVERSTEAADLVEQKSRQFKLSKVVTTDGSDESLKLLLTGQVDAIFDDDIRLSATSAAQEKRDQIEFVGPALDKEHYACMLPKSDNALKAEVDAALNKIFLSGDIQKYYQQWFLSPIESLQGKMINLNLELSSGTKLLYATPNDRAVGE